MMEKIRVSKRVFAVIGLLATLVLTVSTAPSPVGAATSRQAGPTVGTFGAVINTGTIANDANSTQFLQRPNIVHATGTIYAFTYRPSAGGDSTLATINIANDGTFTNTVLDSVAVVDATFTPDLIRISDGVLAIAFNDNAAFQPVRYRTYSVDAAGTLTQLGTLSGFGGAVFHTGVILRHVSGDVYAAVARDGRSTPRLRVETLEISANGTIVGIIDGPDIIGSTGGASDTDFDLVRVRGNIAVVAFEDINSDDGFLASFTLEDNGAITPAALNTLEHDNLRGRAHHLAVLDEALGIIGMSYVGGPSGANGQVAKSFTIDSIGNISQATQVNHGGGGGTGPGNIALGQRTFMYFVDGSSPPSLQSRVADATGVLTSVGTLSAGLPIGFEAEFQHISVNVFAMITFRIGTNSLDLTTFEVENALTSPPPTITSVTPASGLTGVEKVVTISGTGFALGATVTFGGVAATGFTIVNQTAITTTTPAINVPGAVDVVVTNLDGQIDTLAGGYTYVAAPPPTIDSVDPPSGLTGVEKVVTISGTGFALGATVTFGGVPATGITIVNQTTAITTTTPAINVPGAVDVVVTNLDGQSGTLAGGYTYIAPPTVTSVTPNSGSTQGGEPVTITGTDFATGATVTFGGETANVNPATATSTNLDVTTPAHAPGAVDVVVTNPDGQSGTLAGGYEYIPASDRKLLFIQGINSRGLPDSRSPDCGSPERLTLLDNGLPEWHIICNLREALVGLIPPEDIIWFSYAVTTDPNGNVISAGDAGYDDPGSYTQPRYARLDTCHGIDEVYWLELDRLVNGVVAQSPNVKFDIVAHSMGGLVAAYWASQQTEAFLQEHINSIITLDSPLNGKSAAFIAQLNWVCNSGDPSVDDITRVDPTVTVAIAAVDPEGSNVLSSRMKFAHINSTFIGDLLPGYWRDDPPLCKGEFVSDFTAHGCMLTFDPRLAGDDPVSNTPQLFDVRSALRTNLYDDRDPNFEFVSGLEWVTELSEGSTNGWIRGTSTKTDDDTPSSVRMNDVDGFYAAVLYTGTGTAKVRVDGGPEQEMPQQLSCFGYPHGHDGTVFRPRLCEHFLASVEGTHTVDITTIPNCLPLIGCRTFFFDAIEALPFVTLRVVVASPVNILITDPDGRRIGFDPVTGTVVNDIPNGTYSGLGTEPQIIEIPMMLPGQYTLLIIGTGTGGFLTTISTVSEGDFIESIMEMGGTVVEGTELSAEFQVIPEGEVTQLIDIDVKPGSDPNCINLGSQGFVPVAVLTTETFDAADVYQPRLSLEGANARVKGKSGNIGSFEDVDGDGDLDLVVQFPTADLDLTEADTEAVLVGLTADGTVIRGVDSICVVP